MASRKSELQGRKWDRQTVVLSLSRLLFPSAHIMQSWKLLAKPKLSNTVDVWVSIFFNTSGGIWLKPYSRSRNVIFSIDVNMRLQFLKFSCSLNSVSRCLFGSQLKAVLKNDACNRGKLSKLSCWVAISTRTSTCRVELRFPRPRFFPSALAWFKVLFAWENFLVTSKSSILCHLGMSPMRKNLFHFIFYGCLFPLFFPRFFRHWHCWGASTLDQDYMGKKGLSTLD